MSHEALILYGFNVEMKLMIFIVFSLQTSLVSCQMRYVRRKYAVAPMGSTLELTGPIQCQEFVSNHTFCNI